MDKQILKRMKQDITVWQKTGSVDGDSTWAEPITLKGMIVPKYQVIVDREGQRVESQTTILMSGDNVSLITDTDHVASELFSRTKVKAVQPYLSLGSGYEVLQVMI